MKGFVFKLKNTFGFISVDGQDEQVYFNSRELKNCNMWQLEEGDPIEFDIGRGKDGRLAAYNVRKLYQSSKAPDEVRAGKHPNCDLSHYNGDELSIINKLSKFFYVTSGGDEFMLGKSRYKYCLIKPTDYYSKTFQLHRELTVIFCDYVSFEPRSLDAASSIYVRFPSKLRLDRGCQVFISHDPEIEKKLLSLLKDSNLNQIIVPFTYDELLDEKNQEAFIQDRFKKYLFDTDLFSEVAPIQEDVFFFGRRDYAHDIASKCKNNVHSGVFGLRRSGKTSLLYAVQRLLEKQSYPTVFIPCESDLCNLDWRTALCKVVRNVYERFEKDAYNIREEDYRSSDTTTFFEEDMVACLKDVEVPVTLMFDEIEAITFEVSHGEESQNLWRDGANFINFWNTIKGYYSKHPKHISVLVAGTNPMINEVPTIGPKKTPNPMFRQLSQSNQGEYLQAFTEEDTKNMVNTLGGYMGLTFNDHVIGRLVSDCGGHPYLMRMLCSHINRYIRNNNITRPVTVSRSIYEKAAPEFEKSSEAIGFYLMILNILVTSYPKEYNTLKVLALSGDEIIAQTQDKEMLLHLIGYGLVEHNQGNYAIRYNTISNYLRGVYKFEQTGIGIEEQKEEIQFRVNHSEMQLRKLVRNTLRSNYGVKHAKEIVIKAMKKHPSINERNVKKAEELEYKSLFDTSQNTLYFSLLSDIVVDNYNDFSNVFDNQDVVAVRKHLKTINYARRCADHSFTDDAGNWSWEKFEQFRESASWLENILEAYE